MADCENIILSICVVTYNHKQYIEECLESILNQQMNFKYEVIVGNDSSTDGTEEVLRKYEDRVKIINRSENMGLCANLYDLLLRARGKYVVNFSGDDYFNKKDILQKMVDFLESHDEYYSVSGGMQLYNVQKGEMKETHKDQIPKQHTIYDFLSGTKGLTIYGYGVMRNTFYADREWNNYIIQGARNNEEMKMYFYTLGKGSKYFLPESWFVYRFVAEEGRSNYNSTHSELEKFMDYYYDILMMQKQFGNEYNFRPLLLKKSNEFCLKMSDSFGNLRKFLRVMRLRDKIELLWYKCYLKSHHYQDPPEWGNPRYLRRCQK